MAPVRTRKRDSEGSPASKKRAMANNITSPSTPHHRSPMKKRKMGLNLQQKQALIDNLRLEITERARRLRAQYHLQAQGLRSRIEIRLNRIPMVLRGVTMGDLLLKFLDQESTRSLTRPALSMKDAPSRSSPQKARNQSGRLYQPTHRQKPPSTGASGDKENDLEEVPKRKARGETGAARPAQVLSPTSSNSRMTHRDRATPIKPQVSRPGSPLKNHGMSRPATATNVLANMVDKAITSRTGGGLRKVTTASSVSSSSSGTTTASRAMKTATAITKVPPSRPGTRMTRRASGHSESSDGTANTVSRRGMVSKNSAVAPKKVTTAGIKKTVESKVTASAKKSVGGRVLRKRG